MSVESVVSARDLPKHHGVTPMFLFGGVFSPLDRMPGWVQVLAWFIPVARGGGAHAGLILTGDDRAVAGSAAWLVVATALLATMPLNLLRRRSVT